ncbi:MAG: efflux RND transporter periplasmic adaptor subunit [Gammaproteobacteria bacterium]
MTVAIRLLAVLCVALAASPAGAHGDADHAHEDAAPSAAIASTNDAPQRLADGSLFLPKPVQRQWTIRTQPARHAAHAARVELNGTVIPDPATGGRVQATQLGTVLPGPRGMPLPGRTVRQGEVLAFLRTDTDAVERGNQQALLAELDAEHALAVSRLRRYEQLDGQAGAVSQERMETARTELAALEQRRAAVDAGIHRRLSLVAPVSGVIGSSHVVAGQVVDARDVLFEILDPDRLWVEALAYDARLLTSITGADARTDDAQPLALDFVGGARQLRAQALPILFRIRAPVPPLAVGQPVKVYAHTAQQIAGVALPRAALLRTGSGDTRVWLHTQAEQFVSRSVRVVDLDGARVLVTDGLNDGDRVVTNGASLLSQVR